MSIWNDCMRLESGGASGGLFQPELRSAATDLQSLWCVLSVFPASFDREGAAAVWDLNLGPTAKSLSDW